MRLKPKPVVRSVPFLQGIRKLLSGDRAEQRQDKEAAAWLAAVVDSSFDAIISKRLDGTITSWNAAAESLFGYSSADIIGQPMRRLIPKDRQAEEDAILGRVAAGKDVKPFETVRVHKDGRLVDVSITVSPIRTAGGRITGASTIARDIGEHKRAEAALRESEERFRLIFEAAEVGIAQVAPDGSWLRANSRFCEITGYPAEELQAKTFQEITHPDDLAADLAQVSRMLNGEIENYGLDKRYIRKDGSIAWVRLRVGASRKAGGKLAYFIAAVLDISEQVRAETALRESEERLRLANEAAGIGTVTVDLEASRASWSPELAQILGFRGVQAASIEDALTRVHKEDLPRLREVFAEAIAGANAGYLKTEFRFVRPGGEVRWMSCTGRVQFREEGLRGVPYRIAGTCLDITERKRQEEQLAVLVREVNHRAKNMLTLVQAIARQTAAAAPEDFTARFAERVQALASSQDLLVLNQWNGVAIDKLALSQLAVFKDLIGTRIKLKGPSFVISAHAAQTIGMALHELATNAGKYGALCGERGCVEVEWQLERGGGAERTFIMGWREYEGPAVTPPSRKGFGTTVISSLAERSLDAKVSLGFPAEGLRWRLECPASQVLDGGHPHSPS